MKITEAVQLGAPVEHRGVAVAPLFPRRRPGVSYITLEEALPLGLAVTEVSAAGSVPELLARNPTASNVLLYDGEELVGAKQNRILNVTVLVPAEASVTIPVSCVEEGRWSARSAAFAGGRHAAYPELRLRKAERQLAAPMARGVAQEAVWNAVAAKSGRLGTDSPTGAQAGIFASRERDLAELREAFPLQAGQCGAALALAGAAVCLDYVSAPAAFARLYPKLLNGYLLDGLEALDCEPSGDEAFAGLLGDAERAPSRRSASPGLGEDVRLAGYGVLGSGLVVEDELVQLSLYAGGAGGEPTRIARPSRRR